MRSMPGMVGLIAANSKVYILLQYYLGTYLLEVLLL